MTTGKVFSACVVFIIGALLIAALATGNGVTTSGLLAGIAGVIAAGAFVLSFIWSEM